MLSGSTKFTYLPLLLPQGQHRDQRNSLFSVRPPFELYLLNAYCVQDLCLDAKMSPIQREKQRRM